MGKVLWRKGASEGPATFPEYPKTLVRRSSVIVLYEDGEEHLWSEEPDEIKALQVAEEIQWGLRLSHYVRDKLG